MRMQTHTTPPTISVAFLVLPVPVHTPRFNSFAVTCLLTGEIFVVQTLMHI